MKKTLSISEFRKLCDSCPGICFVFDSKNQTEKEFRDLNITLRFPSAITMTNPDRICFTDCSNSLCFNNIEEIRFCKTYQSLIFEIVCLHIDDELKRSTYTILGDYPVS